MSHKLQDAVWAYTRAKCVAHHVLLCIAEHCNEESGGTYPSIARISARTGWSEKTVRRAVQTLIELGEVSVTRKRRTFSNDYAVHLTPPPSGQSDRSGQVRVTSQPGIQPVPPPLLKSSCLNKSNDQDPKQPRMTEWFEVGE